MEKPLYEVDLRRFADFGLKSFFVIYFQNIQQIGHKILHNDRTDREMVAAQLVRAPGFGLTSIFRGVNLG